MSEERQERTDTFDEGFTPAGFEDTAERIRAAMNDQAADTTPSPDAYARLATRVAQQPEGRRRPGWIPPARALVAGVAGLAALAGGFAVLSGDDSGPTVVAVEVADGATGDTANTDDANADDQGSAGTARGPEADGDEPLSDESSQTGNPTAASGDQPSLALGPVAASRQEAADEFLALLGVEPAEVVDVDTDGDGVADQAMVMTVREGEDDFVHPVAELQLAEVDDAAGSGWSVVGATSAMVSIEQPIANQTVESLPFVVSGVGSGFEGWMDIDVRSAVDGSVLLSAGTQGGSFEPAAFSYEAEVPGTDAAWVVVRSSGGADGVALPFAAVPVIIDARPDPTDYVVATVPLDDPDGGLNMRSGPGVDNDKLGVVGWANTVRRTPGFKAERRGDDVWWPVTDESGTQGWVNARFLAPSNSLDGEQLDAGGQQFLLLAASPDFVDRWFQVSPHLGFTVVAQGQTVRVAAADLQRPSGWTDALIDGRSLSELVAAPLLPRNEVVMRPNSSEFVDPAMEDVALRYFAGLPSVTANYLGSDGQAHTTHVFFENGLGGQRYVGAIIETTKS